MRRFRAALILCAVLLLFCAAVNAADLKYQDADEIHNTAQVAMLTDLNLVGGYGDGTFRPDHCITRAEACKLITRIRTESPVADSVSDFTDTADSWAVTYIDYCAEEGIISGCGDGTFNPNSSVTGRELAKMLLLAVDYADGAEYVGPGWSEAVDRDAEASGIYDGFESDPGLYVSRDNACLLIYNALQCPAVDHRNTDGTVCYVLDSMMNPITVLQHRFYVTHVTGVVVADAVCDLRAQDGKLDGSRLHIDGYTRDFLVSDSVAYDTSLIGRKVTVYAIFGSDYNRVVGLPGTRASEVYTTFTNRTQLETILTYSPLNYSSQTKYYVNYNEVSAAILGTLPQENINLTIIDHEGDGVIDIVLITQPEEPAGAEQP